jgi:hypothetical protein
MKVERTNLEDIEVEQGQELNTGKFMFIPGT